MSFEDEARLTPEDLEDARLRREERGYQLVLTTLGGWERRLEESQSRRDDKIVGCIEAMDNIVTDLRRGLELEASIRRNREGELDDIRGSLESGWERCVGGAERAEDALRDVGRQLGWLMDDSRELRRRVVPAGGARSNLAAVFAGGAVACAMLAGLAVAGGLVEVRWTPQVGQVAPVDVVEGSNRSEGQADGVRLERVSPEEETPNPAWVVPPELGRGEKTAPVPLFGPPPALREDGS